MRRRPMQLSLGGGDLEYPGVIGEPLLSLYSWFLMTISPFAGSSIFAKIDLIFKISFEIGKQLNGTEDGNLCIIEKSAVFNLRKSR